MHLIGTANNQSIASVAKGKVELELDEGPIEIQDVLQVPDLATTFIGEQKLQERPDDGVQCRKV